MSSRSKRSNRPRDQDGEEEDEDALVEIPATGTMPWRRQVNGYDWNGVRGERNVTGHVRVRGRLRAAAMADNDDTTRITECCQCKYQSDRCAAIKRDGKRCNYCAVKGQRYCVVHGATKKSFGKGVEKPEPRNKAAARKPAKKKPSVSAAARAEEAERPAEEAQRVAEVYPDMLGAVGPTWFDGRARTKIAKVAKKLQTVTDFPDVFDEDYEPARPSKRVRKSRSAAAAPKRSKSVIVVEDKSSTKRAAKKAPKSRSRIIVENKSSSRKRT